jgi:hypothetical protein
MHRFRTTALLCLSLGLFGIPTLLADPPENEPTLPDTLDSDNALYQLRYDNDPASIHYTPDAVILGAADALDRNGSESQGNPRGYHDGYLDLGFEAAWFAGSPSINDVTFWDCEDPVNPTAFDCNGGFARTEQIVMPAPRYRAASESCVRMVLGHELFHHVEFGYVDAGGGSGCGGVFGTAVCEGQARAMQDKVYFDLDLDPAANCVAPFDGEADSYLDNPDITVWKASYGAALFWTYLMEQYGTINAEPGYGADFITAWWEIATGEVADPDVYDITRRAIQLFEPNQSVVNSYQDFTIANLVKDLSVLAIPAQQRARYTYVDDGPVLAQNNLHRFGKVDVDFFATVPANGAASIELNAQRFGGDYSRFDLSACPAGRQVEFSVRPQFLLPLNPNAQTPVPDALISLVLTKGADGLSPSKLYKWRGKSVKTSFLQPQFQPYTRGFVIVSGWHGSYPGVLTMRCLPAPLAPIVKLKGNQTPPGPGAQPVGSIAVGLPSGASGNAPIGGLTPADFVLQIGGQNAAIRAAVREGDGYRLHFAHPTPTGAGPFAMTVQAAGQTTTIANAIRYDAPDPEVIVVLDLSASMGQPAGSPLLLPAVQKVREAAARMKSSARFGLIGHFGNGSEPDRDSVVLLPLAPLSAGQRANLESVLSTLSPSSHAFAAPGDGVRTALEQFTSNGGNGPQSILLIGDGAQGEGESTTLLLPAIQAARASVHVIALGGRSDQPMLERIARAGAGDYHYVPTAAAGLDPAAFNLAFDSVQTAQTREHVLLARQLNVPAGATVDSFLDLDADLLDASGGAVFSARVISDTAAMPNSIRLFRPDGSEVLAGAGAVLIDHARGRVFQLSTAPLGSWRMQITGGSAAATGLVDLHVLTDEGRGPGGRISLGRPGDDETALDSFVLGEPIELSYARYKLTDVLISSVTAVVERPDGSQVRVELPRDFGQDGFAEGALEVFRTRLDLNTLGSATGIADGGSAPDLRGSYRVIVAVHYGDATGGLVQTATASFAVVNDSTDSDSDGLPDRYEASHLCLDPVTATFGASIDADGDGLTTTQERQHGTDPCNADSDGGGETDGSEVAFAANPLDASDDALGPITDAEVLTRLSGHEEFEPLPLLAHTIRFNADRRYASVLLKVGAGTLAVFSDVASYNADNARGRIVHAGLNDGQTYCYQLVPSTANGRVGAASDIFCSVARTDMTAPTGSIVLNEGAAQTRASTLIAAIAVDNESAVGVEMNLQLPDASETGWIPYQSSYAIPVSALPRPSVARVRLRLRDAAGNESDAYVDDIALIDSMAAGSISGSVRSAGNALGNVLVQIQNGNTQAPDMSAANGDFSFDDLLPATYTLLFSRPGYIDAIRSNISVSGGAAIDLGIVEMQPVDPLLFRDGFE